LFLFEQVRQNGITIQGKHRKKDNNCWKKQGKQDKLLAGAIFRVHDKEVSAYGAILTERPGGSCGRRIGCPYCSVVIPKIRVPR